MSRVVLWVVVPYVALAAFGLGHWWRYRFDKFGWTARSSQLHEQSVLRWAGPVFHGGILLTAAGHAGGLLVPRAATRALGLPDAAYHAVALVLGGVAGLAVVVGLTALAVRRMMVPAVARDGARGDVLMYVLLFATILIGLIITLTGGHDYRTTVSPWLRSILTLRPDPDLMAGSPPLFQAHALVAWLLVAVWPFTRLVHVLSAPLGYLVRPYIVYRRRDAR
jgi:nitrate reductase gamma subunit